MWACASENVLVARAEGHRGIVVQHYVVDGGLYKCLVLRSKQMHVQLAYERKDDERAEGLDPRKLVLAEWVVHTQCVAHGCHNALKWGMAEVCPNCIQNLSHLWEVFASLRENTALLHSTVYRWVVGHVAFRPGAELPPVEEGLLLFTALGCPVDHLHNLAEQWQICWVDDELQVNEMFRHETHIYELISDTLLSLLSTGAFT